MERIAVSSVNVLLTVKMKKKNDLLWHTYFLLGLQVMNTLGMESLRLLPSYCCDSFAFSLFYWTEKLQFIWEYLGGYGRPLCWTSCWTTIISPAFSEAETGLSFLLLNHM